MGLRSSGAARVLNLSNTSSLLQIATGSAVASIAVHATWVDLGLASTTVGPGGQNSIIDAVGVTTVVPPPAAGVVRNVKFLSVQNTSGVACDLAIRHSDGTTEVDLFEVNLKPGFTIQYNTDGIGFVVYDTTGALLWG
jgi:hypothetical protein